MKSIIYLKIKGFKENSQRHLSLAFLYLSVHFNFPGTWLSVFGAMLLNLFLPPFPDVLRFLSIGHTAEASHSPPAVNPILLIKVMFLRA